MKQLKEKEIVKKIMAGAATAVGVVSSGFPVLAATGGEGSSSGYDYTWINNDGNGTFDDLTDTVKDTGASIYKLLLAVDVVCLICIVIVCGIKLAAAGSGKRAEAIEQLIWVFIGGIIVFGAMSIIGFMGTIGANLG